MVYSGSFTGSGSGTIAMTDGELAIRRRSSFDFASGLCQWTVRVYDLMGALSPTRALQ